MIVIRTLSVIICLPVALALSTSALLVGGPALGKHVLSSCIAGAYQLFD